jgi:hypothetical protein
MVTVKEEYFKKSTSLQAHEVVSKIFRTGAAIYTADAVARSTGGW